MKAKLLLFLFLCLSCEVWAQIGTVKGTILDASSKVAIIGANVIVKGTTPPLGAVTDAEGNFEITGIPTGNQVVEISYISFKSKEIELTVYPNQAVLINTALEEDVATLNEVKVVGQRMTFTELSVINEVKKAEQIAVGISSQQIRKSQDRDASQVVRRVPGVSVQDDRFIVVRGLNERYNTVMLNDAVTPSSEVDVKSFSFDLIPSSAIDRIMIYKSGAADLPGEFAGGIIKIYTKTIPDENGFTLNVSTGIRNGSTFRNTIDHQGSSLDFLGFGAGSRKLPAVFPKSSTIISENSPSESTLNAFRKLPDFYTLQNKTVQPDLRLSLGFNRNIYIGDKRLTTFNNINYSNTHQFLPVQQFRYLSFNPSTQLSEININYRDQQYAQNTRLGVMSNWSLMLNPNHKIEFRNLFNQMSNRETTSRTGDNFDNGREVQNYAFRYESKSIYSGQLSGTHDVSDATTIRWTGAIGITHRNEPDFRRFITSRNIGINDPFVIETLQGGNASLTNNARFFSTLQEYSGSFRADIEHRINRVGYEGDDKMQIKLRAGGYVENKDRRFNARWFNLNNPGGVSAEILHAAPEHFFTSQNIAADRLYYIEQTNPSDKYKAQNILTAGYVSAYLPITSRLNAAIGFRGEFNRQQLQSQLLSRVKVDVDNPIFRALPSANVSYSVTDKSQLRLAYSVTVNRPEFRELAPFNYYDFNFDVSRVGNPNLKTPSIQNADIRYEFYPKEGEVISIAGFYKHFRNPIESRVRYSGSGVSFTVDNAEKAYAYGAEIELRKSLSKWTASSFINNLTLLLNASVIKSDVLTGFAGQEENRQLQGQSPYLVNTGIYYNDIDRGLQVNVLYNVVGKRIFMVGDKEVQPTVYEMPRNVIDLNIIKSIGQRMELKLGLQDFLNQQFRLIQDSNLDGKITEEDNTYQQYRRGTYSTIGLSYKF